MKYIINGEHLTINNKPYLKGDECPEITAEQKDFLEERGLISELQCKKVRQKTQRSKPKRSTKSDIIRSEQNPK